MRSAVALMLSCWWGFECAALAGSLANVDECEVIRQALHDGEAVIHVEPEPTDGIYDCRAPIVIDRSHVALIGVGSEKVKIKLAPLSVSPLLIIGSDKPGPHLGVVSHTVSDVTVQNFELDGNRWRQVSFPREDLIANSAGDLFESPDLLSRMRSQECWGGQGCDNPSDPRSVIRNNGITVRGAHNIRLVDLISKNNLSGGLVTEKYSSQISVERFESFNNLYDGFAGYQTRDSVFSEMKLHHNYASAVSIDIDFSANKFLNSDFSDNLDNGIFARESSANRFENIRIHNVCNNGIFLADSRSTQLGAATGYEFHNLSISAMSKGLRINDSTCAQARLLTSLSSTIEGLWGNISLAEGAQIEIDGESFNWDDPRNDRVSHELSHEQRQANMESCRRGNRTPLPADFFSVL